MIGKTVSHYRIIEELGRGGMGVVYRAEDTRLQRVVALKFLSPEMIRDPEARERFVREARAAAGINHPNICTVYEIDEYQGNIFIAMEDISGNSLRDIINGPPLPVDYAVDIATQLAYGLSEAHDRGVVHRDIKPSNIMVDKRGRARIMDFGLAKLKDMTVLTREHSTFGTVSYMSPEQGEGSRVGPRSDIWSLGVVLYEMITGRLPFRGDYDVAVMYSIINENPEPVCSLRADAPPELGKVIHRALAKNPRYRYQSASEMLADLDRLKQALSLKKGSSGVRWNLGSVRWKRVLAAVAVAAVPLAGALLIIQRYTSIEEPGPVLPGQPLQVTSGDAWESEPEISPDGSRIAYTSDISGDREIYVMDSRGGNPLNISENAAADYHPNWFPGGGNIVFTSERDGREGIWKTGQYGGGATLLIENASYPSVSPDGSRIAFSRANEEGNLRIAVTELAHMKKEKILTGDDDGLWSHRWAAWSPGGDLICYCAHHNLWLISPSGGETRQLTSNGRLDSDPAWSSDGSYIYFSSYRSGPLALWRVSVRDGRLQRLTTGTGSENGPSLCRDGSRFVYAAQKIKRNFILRDLASGDEINLKGFRDDYMAALSPDGSTVVYASERAGPRADLWAQALEDGTPAGHPRRLTDHPGDSSHPVFSPDGKWIAYYRIIDEQRDIWIIPSSGGHPARFTVHPASDIHPAWSPDGLMIAFVSEREDGANIWVAPVSDGMPGGKPRRITQGGCGAMAPSWSPDGRQIAFVGMKENFNEVWLCSPDSTGSSRQLTRGAGVRRIRWDPLSGDLLVSATRGNDSFTLWRVSPGDGSLEEITPPLIFGSKMASALFDLTADGKIVYSREDLKANIWLLEAEKDVY
ncbi:MAG: protein kinase [Candidatus Latescibacteria bacterium]|nr:protein kinase [bacterium]MBD3423516.1 protein kinase [Candidatus Latescibacterota bacterium]